MSINKEDKIILGVAGAIIFLVALCVWLGVSFYSEKAKASENKKLYESMIATKSKELIQEREKYKDQGIINENKADSALRIVASLEIKIKKDQIYYANKIKALEKINTYTSRQRFADSLAGTIR